jgi:hypothetical protein
MVQPPPLTVSLQSSLPCLSLESPTAHLMIPLVMLKRMMMMPQELNNVPKLGA